MAQVIVSKRIEASVGDMKIEDDGEGGAILSLGVDRLVAGTSSKEELRVKLADPLELADLLHQYIRAHDRPATKKQRRVKNAKKPVDPPNHELPLDGATAPAAAKPPA